MFDRKVNSIGEQILKVSRRGKTTKGLLFFPFFFLRLRDLWPVQISKTRRSFVQLGVETSKRDQNEPTTGLDRRWRGWRWRGKVEKLRWKRRKMIESTGERRHWPLRGDERDRENSSGGKKWRESGTQRTIVFLRFRQVYSIILCNKSF